MHCAQATEILLCSQHGSAVPPHLCHHKRHCIIRRVPRRLCQRILLLAFLLGLQPTHPSTPNRNVSRH